ncbi:CpXC domain-containing protein [Fidelibacter multiformis]|uniref:CpXC domain-containing protein n=1 Tax=Fidelibacter multiformis TaxID=3377529 RepID=UPI0037DC46CF
MSSSHEERITCPTCGHQQPFEVWDSLNASKNPELKEKLMHGDLTTMVCEACQAAVFVKFDMIYHDLDEKMMILLRYPDENGDVPEFDPESLGLVKAMGDDYILRSVYNFPDFLEKIRIIDDGFDDVTLEILKYMFRVSNHLEPDEMILYEGTKDSKEGDEQIVLIRPMGSEYMAYHYPVDQLSVLDETRQLINMSEFKENDVWLRVDQETIAEQLSLSAD